MPEFDVNQYHTFADRFTIQANDRDEAYALLNTWYAEHDRRLYSPAPRYPDADVAPVQEPELASWQCPLEDPDVAACVYLDCAHDYVDVDGVRVIGPDGEEVDFN